MDPFIKIIKNTFSLIFSFINEVQEMGCIENSSLSCNFATITNDVNMIISYTNSLKKLLEHIQEVIIELQNSQPLELESSNIPTDSNITNKDGKNIASSYASHCIQKLHVLQSSSKEPQHESSAKLNRFKEGICSFPQCQQEYIENSGSDFAKSTGELSVEGKDQARSFYTSVSYQDQLGPPSNLVVPFENLAIHGQIISSSIHTVENHQDRVDSNSCLTESVVSSAFSSTVASSCAESQNTSDNWPVSQAKSVVRPSPNKAIPVMAKICKKCNYEIRTQKTRKVEEHRTDNCCVCPRVKEGVKLKRRGSKAHSCSVCNRVFRNWKHLSVHMKKLHSDGEPNLTEEFDVDSERKLTLPVYCCKTCSSSSKSISNFKNHFCKLPNDEGGELSNKVLITNMRKLQQMKKFVCDTCGVEFRALRRILYHLPRCFPGPYHCNSCANIFDTLKDLNYHKKKDHMNEKCFACDECGKNFLRKASLRKHCINRHEFVESLENKKAVSHKCDMCPKKFIKKIFLTNHKLRMHGLEKKFLCQVCGKKFMSNSSLMIHIDIHKGEKKFVCQYCNKKFQRKEKLLYHVRTHTGEKPFKCDRCEKAFVSKARLNEHLRRHEADKRFECSQCEKSYASSWDLKKHMLKKHNLQISTQCVKISLKKRNEKFDSSHEQIYEENRQQEQVQHLPQVMSLNSSAPTVQVASMHSQSCQMHHVVQVEQSLTMPDTIPVIIHPASTPVSLVSFSEPLEGHCLQTLESHTSPQPLIAQAVNLQNVRSSQIIFSPQQPNQLNYPNS